MLRNLKVLIKLYLFHLEFSLRYKTFLTMKSNTLKENKCYEIQENRKHVIKCKFGNIVSSNLLKNKLTNRYKIHSSTYEITHELC